LRFLQIINNWLVHYYVMVLPLVDEDKPKCYLCHNGFNDIEELREHQKKYHSDFLEFHEKENKRESAPGDVTVF